MFKNLDRKVAYWFVILIPITAFCIGFLVFEWIQWLYPIPVVLMVYFYYSLHRCPECRTPIFSWNRRCGKCDNPVQYYKIETNSHEI